MTGLLETYDRLVLRRPVVALSVVAIVVAFFAYHAPDFRLDASADSLVLENDEALKYYRSIRARYGSDDYLIVTYTPHGDLFSDASLDRLRELRDRLRQIAHVDSVVSILDAPLVESPPVSLFKVNEGLPTLEQPTTDRKLAEQELRRSPLYANRLLSPDGTTTAIQVNLRRDETYQRLRLERDRLREKRLEEGLIPPESDRLSEVAAEFDRYSQQLIGEEAELIRQVRRVIDDYRGTATLHLGGVPMIVADMMDFIRHDLATFGLAVLGILALMLAVVFRRPRWILLPLLTAAAVGIATVGFLGMVGWQVTVVSSNFLALLLIFSLSLTIHLIVRYRELHQLQPDASQRELVSPTLRSKAAPCLFTVLTTMVAFGSLVVSGVRPVIDFGWIMVFAMAASMLLAFSLFPATLMLLEPGSPRQGRDIIGVITGLFARMVERHGGKILLLSGVVVVLSGFGVSRLTVENRFIDYFHSSTEIFRGMKLIDEKLGGTTPLDVVIDAPVAELTRDQDWVDPLYADDTAEGGITATSYWFNTPMLEEVAAMHRYLDELPETGKVLSLHTAMQVLDALDDDNVLDDFFLSILHKRLPEDVRAQMIDPYLSADGNQLRFAIRVYESDIGLNRKLLLDKIRTHLGQERGQWGEKVQLSGMVVLYNNLLQSLFGSQVQTLGVVFLAIALTFALVFRSVTVAAIAIVPNLAAAALVLGLMGGLGIPLDVMTITIAAITVGIAVDDTIHYVHRYHDEWRRDGDYGAAVWRAHGSIGRAMYYTTMAITVGFVVMVLSEFIPTVYFGIFTAFAMICALLANMTVLPVLLRTFRPYGPSTAAG